MLKNYEREVDLSLLTKENTLDVYLFNNTLSSRFVLKGNITPTFYEITLEKDFKEKILSRYGAINYENIIFSITKIKCLKGKNVVELSRLKRDFNEFYLFQDKSEMKDFYNQVLDKNIKELQGRINVFTSLQERLDKMKF